MFELANPWILCLLPIPLLIWILLPKAKKPMAALKVPFFQDLQAVLANEKPALSIQNFLWFPALIWLLLVLAASGPRFLGEPKPIEREAYNLMMVLDLSGSMSIMDMLLNGQPSSRLSVVKRAAKQFVEKRVSDKIGLILFGTRAYLQTPLTFDKQNVLMRIDDATAGLAGQTTSIGDALGLAVKHLTQVSKKGRVIVLLTDGVNNSGVLAPLKAAELAKDEGIKIYTIGLGSEANFSDFLNTDDSLDEKTLKQVAETTGGQYFRATDPRSLDTIYKTIHDLETVKEAQASVRPQKDYYPEIVALALLLSFVWLGQSIRARRFYG